jgi:hypothetical protein
MLKVCLHETRILCRATEFVLYDEILCCATESCISCKQTLIEIASCRIGGDFVFDVIKVTFSFVFQVVARMGGHWVRRWAR